jgi:hypothetical protein
LEAVYERHHQASFIGESVFRAHRLATVALDSIGEKQPQKSFIGISVLSSASFSSVFCNKVGVQFFNASASFSRRQSWKQSQWSENGTDHQVGAMISPLPKRTLRRLWCIRWFVVFIQWF